MAAALGWAPLSLEKDEKLPGYLGDRPFRLGSNNWCVGPGLSEGGKPILANDPHLDARMLPGDVGDALAFVLFLAMLRSGLLDGMGPS